jgi:hypothetical protein
MTFEEWVRASIAETLPPLRRPPPVRLFAHQEVGARRLLVLLRRFGGGLLFDEVGMGKSFTAAAVAREWRGSGTIAAAVPAPLLATWRATLARFGVQAALVSHDSLPALPPLEGRSLLIVDEAHRFRDAATLRHRRLGERTWSTAVLLVTATPLCNRLDDVLALIRLAFADDSLKAWGVPSIEHAFTGARPERIRTILALVGVRRGAGSEVTFPRNARSVIRFSLGATGEEIGRALSELAVPLCAEGSSPALVRSHLRARLESSPEALRDSLERQRRFYRRAREKLMGGFVLRRRDFAALFEREERELFQELLFPEVFLPRSGAAADSTHALDRELRRLEGILEIVNECAPEKFERLDGALASVPLPAIVFTRAIATAHRLWSRYRSDYRTGLGSSRSALDARGATVAFDDLLRAFRARSFDLLILTDLASEGLDLQAAASILHFDLPWTAVKLDQRNGRAIRIGQSRGSVRSLYFVPARAAKAAPIRFLSRKGRLANRFLEPDAFSGVDPAPWRWDVLAAGAGASLMVIEGGVVCRLFEGALSADPRLLRASSNEVVEPTPDGAALWRAWKVDALAVPSRVDRTSPQGRLMGAMSPGGRQAVLRLLDRRYRSGSETALAELSRKEPDPAEIENVLRSLALPVRAEPEARPQESLEELSPGSGTCGVHEHGGAGSMDPGVVSGPS